MMQSLRQHDAVYVRTYLFIRTRDESMRAVVEKSDTIQIVTMNLWSRDFMPPVNTCRDFVALIIHSTHCIQSRCLILTVRTLRHHYVITGVRGVYLTLRR
jgi:hypothetical protein